MNYGGFNLIYSDDWLYVHIPKNGGTNFKNRALEQGATLCDNHDEIYIKHQPAEHWIDEKLVGDKQIITTIREPFRRMVSLCRFIREVRNPSFPGFTMDGIQMLKGVELAAPAKFHPLWDQGKWMNEKTKWFKIDSSEDLKEMEKLTGIKFKDTKDNSQDYSDKPWYDYYNEELEDTVRSLFKNDFKRFNYPDFITR